MHDWRAGALQSKPQQAGLQMTTSISLSIPGTPKPILSVEEGRQEDFLLVSLPGQVSQVLSLVSLAEPEITCLLSCQNLSAWCSLSQLRAFPGQGPVRGGATDIDFGSCVRGSVMDIPPSARFQGSSKGTAISNINFRIYNNESILYHYNFI